MSYSDVVKKTRVRITKENNDRARRMERRLANRLGGNRVPMSGGGFMKGDIFVNRPDVKYIVECKTTSMRRETIPAFYLKFAYLEKLEDEVSKMGVPFGVLAFHMHNSRKDYIVISDLYLQELVTVDPVWYNSFRIVSSGKSYTITEVPMLARLTPETPFMSLTSTNSGRSYTIMRLETFESILEKSKEDVAV